MKISKCNMGFRPHRQTDLTKVFNLCYGRLIEVLSQICKHLPGSFRSSRFHGFERNFSFFPNPKEQNRKAWGSGLEETIYNDLSNTLGCGCQSFNPNYVPQCGGVEYLAWISYFQKELDLNIWLKLKNPTAKSKVEFFQPTCSNECRIVFCIHCL